MRIRRSAIAGASVVFGLAILAAAGFALRDRIITQWRLWSPIKVTGGVRFSGTVPPRPPPISMAAEQAWCAVFDHPFFSVTNEKGEYEIRDLPPGKYTLTAWHERYGVQSQEIQVPWLGSRTVEFDYPLVNLIAR